MARVALTKWGHDLVLRLPKAVVQAMGVASGSEVEIAVSTDGTLTARPLRRRLKLANLVRRMTPTNRHEATDWGKPVGREVW